MWSVTPGKKKSNTFTYYKREKGQSTYFGHYHPIFFSFALKQTQTNPIVCFVSFKAVHQILFSFIDLSILETTVYLELVLQLLL